MPGTFMVPCCWVCAVQRRNNAAKEPPRLAHPDSLKISPVPALQAAPACPKLSWHVAQRRNVQLGRLRQAASLPASADRGRVGAVHELRFSPNIHHHSRTSPHSDSIPVDSGRKTQERSSFSTVGQFLT